MFIAFLLKDRWVLPFAFQNVSKNISALNLSPVDQQPVQAFSWPFLQKIHENTLLEHSCCSPLPLPRSLSCKRTGKPQPRETLVSVNSWSRATSSETFFWTGSWTWNPKRRFRVRWVCVSADFAPRKWEETHRKAWLFPNRGNRSQSPASIEGLFKH